MNVSWYGVINDYRIIISVIINTVKTKLKLIDPVVKFTNGFACAFGLLAGRYYRVDFGIPLRRIDKDLF